MSQRILIRILLRYVRSMAANIIEGPVPVGQDNLQVLTLHTWACFELGTKDKFCSGTLHNAGKLIVHISYLNRHHRWGLRK